MRIDQTRLKIFRDNPELFRLQFLLNKTPARMPESLATGTAMHQIIDLRYKEISDADVRKTLTDQQIPDRNINIGFILADALAKRGNSKVLISEQEFEYKIYTNDERTHYKHSLVGKIDRIVEDNGQIKIIDFKSAHANKKRGLVDTQWLTDIQADAYFLGARSLGYEADEMEVHYALQSSPITLWEPIRVTRTARQLALMERYIHIYCETVELWTAAFGIEEPWPHNGDYFFCKTEGKWECEFKNICQTTLRESDALPGFQQRIEHLDLLRSAIQ